jgi:hypothetical protein
MSLYGILLLLLWEVILPAVAGTIFISVWRPVVSSIPGRFAACLVSGQLLFFAVFQAVTVPLILKGKTLPDVLRFMKPVVGVILAAAVILFVIRLFRERGKKTETPAPAPVERTRPEIALWVLAALLLVLQLVMNVLMTYADGDDSFYIAIATAAEVGGKMYAAVPYTGIGADLDFRYALAPFPVWISTLSRLSGVAASSVAHVFFSGEMILLGYVSYGLLGKLLLRERKQYLPLFLVGLEVLVLFGDVSSMTPENFLLARSRQGKAALATLVIPMLIVLLYLLVEHLQDKEKFGFLHWVLLGAAIMTACMCSTLGAALCVLLLGCAGLCSAVMTRKIRHLPLLILVCVPCLVYGGLYLMLG